MITFIKKLLFKHKLIREALEESWRNETQAGYEASFVKDFETVIENEKKHIAERAQRLGEIKDRHEHDLRIERRDLEKQQTESERQIKELEKSIQSAKDGADLKRRRATQLKHKVEWIKKNF